LVANGETRGRSAARSKTAALRRELGSDGEAKSRQSSVQKVASGVRLDLCSPFEANSRRVGERDCSNRRRRRTSSFPPLNAGVSVSRLDGAKTPLGPLSIGC
jgi:hypothetical protein